MPLFYYFGLFSIYSSANVSVVARDIRRKKGKGKKVFSQLLHLVTMRNIVNKKNEKHALRVEMLD